MEKTITKSLKRKNVFVYRDKHGRIYVDSCKTPAEHMTATADAAANRRLCQDEIGELVPHEGFEGPGDIEIIVRFTPKQED